MKAYIAKISRQRKTIGLWKPIKEWRELTRGPYKGMYEVILADGHKALATRIGGEDVDTVQEG